MALPGVTDGQQSPKPAGRAFTMLDLLPEANSLSQIALALRAWDGFLSYQLVRR